MVQFPYQNRYDNREIFSSSSHQIDLARIIDIKYIHRVFLLSSIFEKSWYTNDNNWQLSLLLETYPLRFLEIVWYLFAALYHLLDIPSSTFFLTYPNPYLDIFLFFL